MNPEIPSLTVEQMREVDRLMAELGIGAPVMMELAGRIIKEVVLRMCSGGVKALNILVVCGTGNNGGDGMAAARHLINGGARVKVALAAEKEKLHEFPLQQYKILKRMGAIIEEAVKPGGIDSMELDVIIDALLGFSIKGNPKEPIASLINAVNVSETPVLSVDLPSGLEGNSGLPHSPTVRATATVTFALPKTGLLKETAKEYVGDLYVGDISVPACVYKRLGIAIPDMFEKGGVIKVK